MSQFVEPGDVFPAISLPDLDGQAVAVDHYRDGRRLLLFMWASW